MRRAARIWPVLALGVSVGLAGCAPRAPDVFPGKEWSWKAPEAAGFSSDRLRAVGRKIGGSGCIVHGGEMIYSWGDIRERRDAGSSIKPLYAHLLYKAVETGRVPSLDARVAEWVPEIGDLNPDLGFKDRDITFRHLLNHVSGYGLTEAPGEAFAYNDYAVGLLVWTLFRRVWGVEAGEEDALLNGDLLGAAIGFEDRPTVENPDSKPGRICISARDMARFMLLYLRGGRWNGVEVVRADLYREAMGAGLGRGFPRTAGREAKHWETVKSIGGGKDLKNHLGCFHFFWWFNRRTPDGDRFLPDVPKGTFMGSGWGGRAAMIAIPEEDLVVVWLYIRPYDRRMWTPLSERGRFKVNHLLTYLLEARTFPPVPPGTPQGP